MAASARFRDRWRHWFHEPGEVRLVCEIAADYVAAVRHHRGRIESWAAGPLPEGAVQPAPLAENIANPGALQEALEHVLGMVADGLRRCVLIVPDLVARVALLEFDHLPERVEEAERLLRWRLKKDLPFDVRQAVLSYQTQAGHASTREALVVVCLRGLLRQYEECLERLGVQPGWVTLSTLAVLGCLDSSGAPGLLVKRDHGSLGLAIVHGQAVRLFRSLPTAGGSRPLSENLLLEKVWPAAVYFQDQWNQPVSEVVWAGAGRAQPELMQQLEREAGCRVTEFSPAAFGLPVSPISGAAPDHRLAASVGWVGGEAV